MSSFDPRDPQFLAEARRLSGLNPHGPGALKDGAHRLPPSIYDAPEPSAPVGCGHLRPQDAGPDLRTLMERADIIHRGVAPGPMTEAEIRPPDQRTYDPVAEALELGAKVPQTSEVLQEARALGFTAQDLQPLAEDVSDKLKADMRQARQSGDPCAGLKVMTKAFGNPKLMAAVEALETIADTLGMTPVGWSDVKHAIAARVSFLAQKKLDRESFDAIRWAI